MGRFLLCLIDPNYTKQGYVMTQNFFKALMLLFLLSLGVTFAVTGCGDTSPSKEGQSSDASSADTSPDQKPASQTLTFPKGFMWGTSIAGFQGEMGCPTLPPEECEDKNSDWYQWVTTKEIIEKTLTGLNGEKFDDYEEVS